MITKSGINGSPKNITSCRSVSDGDVGVQVVELMGKYVSAKECLLISIMKQTMQAYEAGLFQSSKNSALPPWFRLVEEQ